MRLQDRVALITGGGSGIGAAAARHMAAAGAKIAVCGIPADGVNEVAASLRADGFEAIGLPTDVADEKQVEAAVQLHDRDHTLHELDTEAWDLTHSINFRGTMLTCKYALQQMLPQQSGAIVIISSVTAMGGGSPNVAYLTGKHALLGLNRHIGKHYGRHGIRCNCICPGALEKTPNHDIHPDPEGRAQQLAESIPLGRPATPEDIAPWVTFLSSDKARYANGTHFLVDGGMSA